MASGWWATDPAVANCAATRGARAAAVAHVSEHLAVVLGAYAVNLDLPLCDFDGNVLANGRSERLQPQGPRCR